MPAANGGGEAIRFGGPPRAGLIRHSRVMVDEHTINNSPRGLDGAARREEGSVSRHCSGQQSFVRRALERAFRVHHQLALEASELFARALDARGKSNAGHRAQSEPQVIGSVVLVCVVKELLRWAFEVHDHLATRVRKHLARAQEPRHARPPPGIDVEAHRGKGLDIRIGRHPRFLSVAAELAPHHIVSGERTHRSEHRLLRDLHGVVSLIGRRFHRKQGDDLKHVVLNDVPQRASRLVESAAPLHAEVFRQSDLDVIDVLPVPHRLKERVREPHVEEVHDLVFAQVMVDAIHRVLGERGAHHIVKFACGSEVTTKGLLDDDAPVLVQAMVTKAADHIVKERGRDREIVRRSGGANPLEFLAQASERRRLGVVAIDVVEESKQCVKVRVIGAAALEHGLASPLAQVVGVPPGVGDPHNRHRQFTCLDHRAQGGKDLLARKVATCAKEHEGVCVPLASGLFAYRTGLRHGPKPPMGG